MIAYANDESIRVISGIVSHRDYDRRKSRNTVPTVFAVTLRWICVCMNELMNVSELVYGMFWNLPAGNYDGNCTTSYLDLSRRGLNLCQASIIDDGLTCGKYKMAPSMSAIHSWYLYMRSRPKWHKAA